MVEQNKEASIGDTIVQQLGQEYWKNVSDKEVKRADDIAKLVVDFTTDE